MIPDPAAYTPDNPPRIAVIGCGAAAEKLHLPAMRSLGLRAALLVEPARTRHEALAGDWGAPVVSTVEGHIDDFDAAIVCVPNHLHRDVSQMLLEANKDVLVEKPLTVSAQDARKLRDVASSGSGSIAVAYLKRFLRVNAWVAAVVGGSSLGELRGVVVEDGLPDLWEAETPGHLTRDLAGGGVLIDNGVHTLDVLGSWLGTLRVVEYRDDALGGLEAEAKVELVTEDGVPVSVRLSRIRTLGNTAWLRFDAGEIAVHLHQNLVNGDDVLASHERFRGRRQTTEELCELQLRAWLRDLAEKTSYMPSAEEAMITVELIETCYDNRQPLIHPWEISAPLTAIR